MKRQLFHALAIFTFVGCENVHFDKAMPTDQKNLGKFDSELTGKYYCSDSTWGQKKDELYYNLKYFSNAIKSKDSICMFSADLTITDNCVFYNIDINEYYNILKVDTSRIIKQNEKADRHFENNYLVINEKIIDTILNLTTEDKLFHFEGKYYLNHYIENKGTDGYESSWAIYQFEIKGNNLFSINETNKGDTDLLIDTAKQWHPIFPVAHISNKQFKNFVANGGFRQGYSLVKYKH